MARKKKTDDVMNQMYNVLNNIESRGNVKIKVYNNNTLVNVIEKHNTGTVYLCRFIRDSLIGLNTSVDQPTIIKPCSKKSGQLVPMSNIGVPFVSRWKGADDYTSSIAVIKFIIPWTKLSASKNIEGFQLFSKDTDNDYYAEIFLDDPITIGAHTNIEVEWSLKISFVTD